MKNIDKAIFVIENLIYNYEKSFLSIEGKEELLHYQKQQISAIAASIDVLNALSSLEYHWTRREDTGILFSGICECSNNVDGVDVSKNCAL